MGITRQHLTLGEGIPKICIPLVGANEEELFTEAASFFSLPADLAEWRADCLESILEPGFLEQILLKLKTKLPDIPLLFTFRTRREGGNQEISREDYKTLLLRAICSGCIDFVDIELFSGTDTVKELVLSAQQKKVATILSNHDFYATPEKEELMARLMNMEALGADIAKIAVTPQSPQDVITLLSATAEAKERLSCPVITMSMGGYGVISRISGELFGSCITFGSGASASAPGQIPALKLKQVLELIHNSF